MLGTFATALFQEFQPKQLDRTWLCTSVTLTSKVLEGCSKAQKTRQVLYFAMIKKIGWVVRIFCEWHKWRTFRPRWPN